MNMARERWENYPYYTGPCPSPEVAGAYEDEDRGDCRRRRRCHRDDRCDRCGHYDRCSAIFAAYLPVAIGPNGVVPLVVNNPCRDSDFTVNSGMITLEKAGVYLASYDVRLPAGATMNTTLTLNVDGASQSTAITQVETAGTGTAAYSAQAIFEAGEGANVDLRTSDAISITDPSAQPAFTLSLVRLEE